MAHQFPVRIYYEDTDMQGIVYYANYLKYYERARTEFLRSLGFEQDQLIEQLGVAFAVRHIEADYKKPAIFNDQLIVETRIEQLKKVSLNFSQTIIRPSTGNEVINVAKVKVACLDANTMAVKAIPNNMLEKLV